MEGEETFDPSFPGHADEVVEDMISDDETILVNGTKNTSVDSVILRGANDFMLDEFEPSLHDALFILKRTLESNMAVAGGGAVEAALSVYLENQSTTLGSREQLAIGEFAESLLITPKVHNELTLEGPSESPGIGKARLVERMSQPVCGPNILTANLDGKCAWNWYADRAQDDSERHDHCPLGRLGVVV